MGFDPLSERTINTGRIDVVLEIPNTTYIIELKLGKSLEDALRQVHEREYYKPYTHKGKKLVFIGTSFSPKNRNIWGREAELLSETGEFSRETFSAKEH